MRCEGKIIPRINRKISEFLELLAVAFANTKQTFEGVKPENVFGSTG
jgi:hypothetical protein